MDTPSQSETARSGRARLAWRSLAAGLLWALLPGSVPALPGQAPALVALTRDTDPVLRGEAALLLAALGDGGTRTVLRGMLDDRDPQVRVRAILALGALAAPGADSELGAILADRDAPDLIREAAVYALGSLPDDRPTPAVDAFLARIGGGSHKRHRDTLAALLAGLQCTPHPLRRAQIDAILQDDSVRDAGLIALALDTLRSAGGTLRADDVRRLLGMRDDAIRLAVLRSLQGTPPGAELHAELEQLARRARDLDIRAAALRALAVADASAAVRTLARRALAHGDPRLIEAGVTVLTTTQGAEDRAEAAAVLRDDPDHERVRAVLRGWVGVPSADVLPAARGLLAATDLTEPDEALALGLLAAAREPDAPDLIRAFARRADDPEQIARALDDLHVFIAEVDPITELGPWKADETARLAIALEAIGRRDPELAARVARSAFDRADADDHAARLRLVRAWRRVLRPPPTEATLRALSRDLAASLR